MSDYTNAAQQRILSLIQVLAGHEMVGLAPGEIASLQRCAPAMVTRDLANLREAGLAEQLPETQRWRLAPTVVRLAIAHMVALDRAARKMDEIRGRYGSDAGADAAQRFAR